MADKIKCLECGSVSVVRKGLRKCKFGDVQKYYCKDCGGYFTLKKLVGKSYSAKVVMDAISNYNMGYTLEESSKLVNKRFKVKVSVGVVREWLKEYKGVCSYSGVREKGVRLCKPGKVVFSKVFFHKQPYKFQYHRMKLDMFLKNFKSLRFYIKNIAGRCPDKMFLSGERGSSVRLGFDFSEVDVYPKFNYACKLAKLALTAADDNKKRHDVLQRFMLVNDSCTVACEVPVYILPSDMKDYAKVFTGFGDGGVTGHIDVLQVRFGRVYILDYKPGSESEKKEKVMSQLFVYFLCLAKRTNVPMRYFRCAWFDDSGYYEFNPNKVMWLLNQGKVLKVGEGLNERQKKALELIELGERVSNKDLQELFPDVTRKTISRDMKKMVDNGIVKTVGKGRGFRYVKSE